MHTRITRILPAALVTIGLVLACGDDGPGPDRYEASADGASEVPANNSTATGTLLLTDRGGRFDYTLTVQDIDNALMAHIHAGAPGVNGGILVTLFTTQNPVVSFSGTLAAGSFAAADIEVLPNATAAISMDSLRVLLRSNGAYVNVHTLALPNGEIRGQITRR